MKEWIDINFLEWAQEKKWFWRGLFCFLGEWLLETKTYGVQHGNPNRIFLDKLYLSFTRASEVYESRKSAFSEGDELVLWAHEKNDYKERISEYDPTPKETT